MPENTIKPTVSETETTTENSSEVKKEIVEQPSSTYDDETLEAMADGWRPPSDELVKELEVKGKKPLTAKEYNERKSFFKRIEQDKKEIKTLRDELDSAKKGLSLIEERAYKKALDDLITRRDKAIDNYKAGISDKSEFYKVEKEIADQMNEYQSYSSPTQEQPKQQENKVDLSAAPKELQDFVSRNSWYDTNIMKNESVTTTEKAETLRMMQAAAQLEAALMTSIPDLGKRLEFVEEHIKQTFPHRFTNPKRLEADRVPVSEKRESSVAGQAKKITLTPFQQEMAELGVKKGLFKSVEEYQEKLKERTK